MNFRGARRRNSPPNNSILAEWRNHLAVKGFGGTAWRWGIFWRWNPKKMAELRAVLKKNKKNRVFVNFSSRWQTEIAARDCKVVSVISMVWLKSFFYFQLFWKTAYKWVNDIKMIIKYLNSRRLAAPPGNFIFLNLTDNNLPFIPFQSKFHSVILFLFVIYSIIWLNISILYVQEVFIHFI